MEFLKNQSINSESWKKFIEGNSFLTPFQTPEFYDFYNSIKGQQSNVYAIAENNTFVALCVVTIQKEPGLKGNLSKRAIVYGGCILNVDRKDAFNALLEHIVEDLRRDVIYLEIRNYLDYSTVETSVPASWLRIPYYNYHIKLAGRDIPGILKAMNYNRRREINLSFKEGARVEEASSLAEVSELYEELRKLYQQRVKLPIPQLEFFLQLYKSEIGKVFIVKHNDKIIGGSFCIFYPGSILFTYYYYGNRNYHPKIFPNHLAIYAAIEFGLNNGLKKIDLMGAGKPQEVYGVRNYKAAFGGELQEQNRYLYITKPLLYKLGVLGLRLMKSIK